jgi:hypothetical protein
MKPTYDEIKRLFGDLNDHMIAEIKGGEATMSELQEVAAYLAQENDPMGEPRPQLSGRSLAVFELLRRLDARWEEDR